MLRDWAGKGKIKSDRIGACNTASTLTISPVSEVRMAETSLPKLTFNSKPTPRDFYNNVAHLPQFEKNRLVLELYNEGFKQKEIALLFGVTRQRVHQILSEQDYVKVKQDLKRFSRKQMLRLHDEGLSPDEIAQRMKITAAAVRQSLRDLGVQSTWFRNVFTPLPDDLIQEGEEWRLDETGWYSFSNIGRAFSHKSGRLVGVKPHTLGYCTVPAATGSNKTRWIHREVVKLFVGPIPEGYEVNHIDGNKSNNRVENLEIVTHQQNVLHSWRVLGRKYVPRVGWHPVHAKVNADQVREIRRRAAMGEKNSSIAKDFGLFSGTVLRIVTRKSWKTVE
jgi:predicted transcriptional regulator